MVEHSSVYLSLLESTMEDIISVGFIIFFNQIKQSYFDWMIVSMSIMSFWLDIVFNQFILFPLCCYYSQSYYNLRWLNRKQSG